MPEKPTELPEPWYWTETDFSEQLQIELSPDSFLKNKPVKTIAKRQDNDDVLFETLDGKFVIVHLTWRKRAHEDTRWPTTKIYDTWQDVENKILKDAKDFE